MEKHGLFRGGVVHLFRGPDLKTSGFLIFLISLIIDLYQVQIWRPPFFLIFLIQSIKKMKN